MQREKEREMGGARVHMCVHTLTVLDTVKSDSGPGTSRT